MRIETTPVVFKVFFKSLKKKKRVQLEIMSVVNIQKSLHISLLPPHLSHCFFLIVV